MNTRALALLLVILTISACQSTPVTRTASAPELDTRDPAALVQQAALETNEDERIALLLAASSIYARGGDLERALDVIVVPDPVSTELRDAVARQRASVLNMLGRFPEARANMAQLTQLTVEDLIETAQICAAMDDHRCAADGYIQAAEKSDFDPSFLPEAINDIIWAHLSQARRGPPVFTHRYHHAWWLLQQDMRAAESAASQVGAWQRWRERNPSHPARISPPAALARLDQYQTPKIGVLLPLSGDLAQAGEALRDGLISAYLADTEEDKPEIVVYDSAANDLAGLVERALSDATDVLVGPLVKENVDRFATIADNARIPTLVLNYLTDESAAHDHVYQLGIAIEDEAATLATAVLADGHEKVLIIRSDAAWSNRATDQFKELWRYSYSEADFADIKGLTEAVGESMQVAASEERRDEVTRILGESVEFLPRARKDLDAVVALTTQLESRALIPALEFHFAADLPVYATSQSARGPELKELEGFTISELPIFAYPNDAQSEMVDVYNLGTSPLAELYALGFDAYKIATWLPLLSAHRSLSLDSATGFLNLESNGRFRRELSINGIAANGSLLPLD